MSVSHAFQTILVFHLVYTFKCIFDAILPILGWCPAPPPIPHTLQNLRNSRPWTTAIYCIIIVLLNRYEQYLISPRKAIREGQRRPRAATLNTLEKYQRFCGCTGARASFPFALQLLKASAFPYTRVKCKIHELFMLPSTTSEVFFLQYQASHLELT